jgi:Tol biopolymer transport system component
MLGVVLLAILAALAPSAAVAAFPGGNGRIAYSATVFSDPGEPIEPYHIFTVLPDGSGKQQLTDAPVSDFQPSWSADGGSLVFVRGGPTGAAQLFTMNADGSGQTRIADVNASDLCIDPCPSPSFSPSGRRIVYTTGEEIITVRSDGSDPRRLVRGDFASPRWSPNGRRIAFSGLRGERFCICTVRRDGSHLRRLFPGLASGGIDYSPDGRHILFARPPGDIHEDPSGIYLMRANGSRQREIPGTDSFDDPAFAPAGDRIVMRSTFICCVGPPFIDLFTISRRGSDRRWITGDCPGPGDGDEGCFAYSPSWQPLP